MNKIILALLISTLYGCATEQAITTDTLSQTSITTPQPQLGMLSELYSDDTTTQNSTEEENLFPRIARHLKQNIASWYGSSFHGKKTSSGEIYDMYAMTAAHKTLPIPSYARVTNLENQRSVIVLINDRGPFHNDRDIDLSYAAAKKLNIHQKGVGAVEIKALTPEHALTQLQLAAEKQEKNVYLRIGTFADKNKALKLQNKIASHNLPHPEILPSTHQGATLYKVQMGPVESQTNADMLNMQLAKLGVTGTLFVN